MSEPLFPPPPAPSSGFEVCYRHPQVTTGVHCTRCGRPICPDCMIPAPVGHHCPECVEAAKREFKVQVGVRPATARSMFPVTVSLVAIIIAGYVLQQVSSWFFEWAVLYPPFIAQGEYWRLVTVMLLHGGIMHLAFNMFALWSIGRSVETALGHLRFLALFLCTGVLASASAYALGDPGVPVVGASGAVFGLFGALLAMAYRRRRTPAGSAMLRELAMLLLINAIISFLPGISWQAHIGGLVAGFVGGFLIEEAEERRLGPLTDVAVFGALLAVAVVLVVMRTQQLHTLLGL